MKIFSLAIIGCFLIISTLYCSSSAAPTLQLQQHQASLSHVKRSQNDLFFIEYSCHVLATINIIGNKLTVSSTQTTLC